MLYIFHVDTGTMLTFDMNLALESVSHLQTVIDSTCQIPVEKQVLLVSGGESLDPNARVCSYSSGTDTNPIFLFSKSVIESTQPPAPSIEMGSDFDMKDKVESSLNMPASYSTVVSRAQLAQEFCELAREQSKICEKLVHDQHLQQQGWAAVVANLEDITAEFKSRSDKFQQSFSQYLEMRMSYLDFLQNFSHDLQTLAKIPILPCLQIEPDLTEPEQPAPPPEPTIRTNLTLLQWISAADNQSSLDLVAEQCSRGLEQLDDRVIESLTNDVKQALESANNTQMKEVKGLGDRLYGLEQLMHKSKKYVQEQSILAQTFLQNQNRASNLGDPSILPDLCDSHRKQLALMLENHQNLRDIRRRCSRAKEELSVNLYHRLKWIMYVENLILEIDHKLMIYHESLKRLRRHVEIIQQIHIAPATYLNAVAEVVRRRAFSQAFLMWASELACHILTIHNDEVTRRKEFQTQFEGHFLNTLFPGMEDLPPSFATQAPSIFDSKLPKITSEDIDRLKTELPDLTKSISVPDMSGITQFFFVKSQVKEDKVDERGVEEKLVQAVNEVGLASNLDKGLLKPVDSEPFLSAHAAIPHLKDLDKGCESETDTEEFEKVGQSPMELNFDSKNTVSPRPGTSDVATLTEDNLTSSKMESEKLRTLISQMAVLAKEAISQLHDELGELKAQCTAEKELIDSHCSNITETWEKLIKAAELKERESLQRLTVDHELEQSDLKKVIQGRNEEIQSLRAENQCLERSLIKCREESRLQKDEYERLLQLSRTRNEELNKQISSFEEEKERAIKEAKSEVDKEYKAEMDSMRSRFKFMSLMERSPSDSSLEKIDHNIIDIVNHNAIVNKLKEDLNAEKEQAVKDAVEQERIKWETRFEEEKIRSEAEKQVFFNDAMNRVVEEKERQIEILRERESSLNLECIKYKNTIQQLIEQEGESNNSLLEKLNELERGKCQLELDLFMERSRRVEPQGPSADMAASVAVFEGKVDAATSPTRIREKLTVSQTNLIQAGKINIASCNFGDPVLVVWDNVYKNYVILQESSILYFLNSECLDVLGLKPAPDGSHRKLYSTAEVIDKEYCHARKAENRYNVPKGTKFYRIKVKPLPHSKDLLRSHHHCQHHSPVAASHEIMSQSQTNEQVSSVILSNSNTESQSVPTSPTKTDANVPVPDKS